VGKVFDGEVEVALQPNQKVGTTDPKSREQGSAHEELDLDRVVNY
jgi:hypothetical protein